MAWKEGAPWVPLGVPREGVPLRTGEDASAGMRCLAAGCFSRDGQPSRSTDTGEGLGRSAGSNGFVPGTMRGAFERAALDRVVRCRRRVDVELRPTPGTGPAVAVGGSTTGRTLDWLCSSAWTALCDVLSDEAAVG